MAVVYSAFDPALERRVAVKVLPPEIAETPDLVERFKREARLVASLQHPNVVSVYGVRTDGEISAIIMQFVDGRSLDVALRDDPMVPLPVAGMVLSQTAMALQHAHERGVVHRDVKPANVLLDKEGRAVVSDFGIARREGGTRLTGTGVVMGTVAYMSPEQCLGEGVTAASDQYSFGVMAFELLAGKRPFSGNVVETLTAHVNDPPPSLAELRPDVPRDVTSYVMRALEKEPGNRHADLRDAERVLRALVRDPKGTTNVIAAMSVVRPKGTKPMPAITEGVTVMAPPPRAPAVSLPETVRMSEPAVSKPAAAAPAAPGAPRSRAMIVVGATAVIMIAALAGWRLTRGTSTTASPTQDARQSGTVTPPPPQFGGVKPVPGVPNNPAGSTPLNAARGASPTNTSPQILNATAKDSAPAKPQQTAPVAARDTAVGTTNVAAAVTTPPAAAPTVSATRGDASAVLREFVTLCNHRQWQDLERLGALDGGTAGMRAELVQLVHDATDFAAGFDRGASSPIVSGDRFTTDFVIDLEWRGGKKLATVRLQAAQQNGGWHVVAFSVSAAQ